MGIASEAGRAHELERHLGWVASTSLLVGGVVGSGIFLVPQEMLANAPSVPVCLAIWVVAGVLSFLGSLTFAELGTMLPHAGGEYVYLRAAYGNGVGFVYGWVLFAVIQSGSIAAVATAFGDYAARLFGHPGSTAWAAAAIVATALVNLRTSRVAVGLQTVVTAAKCLALLGLCSLAFLDPGRDAAALCRSLPDRPITLTAIGVAVMGALWAYDGWNAVSLVAGEVRDPVKTLPKALIGGLGLVVLLYLFTFSSYIVCLGPEGIVRSKQVAADVGGRVLGPVGDRVMSGLIALSTFGTVLGMMFTCPRTYYAMAHDKAFFAAAGWIHPTWRTPYLAVFLQAVWALALLTRGTFNTLLNYVMFASWLFYALTAASLPILRGKLGGPGPFPTPGYPFTPIAFCSISVVLMVTLVISSPWESLYGVLMIGAGFVLYRCLGCPGAEQAAPDRR
ncbi:MAG: amino acid permease [Candidatus Riflebacteria bacterium]|nr:amino acid permease [Candidatus Riflebacteria bacterium]